MKRHVYVTFAPLPRDWEVYRWRSTYNRDLNYAFGPLRLEIFSD
jgi:hypothetical protein